MAGSAWVQSARIATASGADRRARFSARSRVVTSLSRPPSAFRDRITADDGPFRAEAGRYHLYVSLACPWAHRTLIMRSLKGLSSMVGLSVVHSLMGEDGWTFAPGPGVVADDINGVTALHRPR